MIAIFRIADLPRLDPTRATPAGLALWQAGILDEIPGIWLAIGAIVAVGFGIMLAVASTPRAVTTTTTRDV